MKKLAIQLFGHMRTYEKTYKNFLKNIVEANKDDGWEIDIFIHTWDKLSSSEGSWHAKHKIFKNEREIQSEEVDEIIKIYNPVAISVEKLPDGIHGGLLSKQRGNRIRERYQITHSIDYEYIIYTRADVLFCTPLKVQRYIDEIKKSGRTLPDKHVFCGNNFFRRSQVADPRYINEGDIIYFSSASQECYKSEQNEGFLVIPVNYTMYKDFFLQREDFILGWNTHPEILLENKIKQLELEVEENNTKIEQLEIFRDDLLFKINYTTAKIRIQNQLSYKLGQAMIVNSKSILGYIRMPFVLSYIKDKHKQEQKIYQEKIKKDPSLALPPLESYPDYKEALKEKECLTYKLGQALIQANKTWYGGGYIKLLFEIRKLKKQS